MTAQNQPVAAKLTNLTDPASQTEAERYEGFQAGGGGVVRRQQLQCNQAECLADGQNLAIRFDLSTGSVEATSQLLGLPESWKGYGKLVATVEAVDQPMHVELVVVGARSRLIEQAALTPGRSCDVEIDLVDLPLTAGIRAAYEPTGVRFVGVWDGDETRSDFERNRTMWTTQYTDPADVPPPGAGPRTLRVTSLRLLPAGPEGVGYCVDRFGQRASTTWSGKVSDESELTAFRDEELKQLQTLDEPADRNEYGGWTKGPTFDATGFFRVEQRDGVWWMVDPAGAPFYSIGTTGVRTSDNTIPGGREELYEALPPTEGPEADAWLEGKAANLSGVSFYRWNIIRKYGSREAWRDRVLLRFRKWGFNTIANWSEATMLDQQTVPHCRTTASRDENFPLITRQFADAFDPRYEGLLDEKFSKEVAPHRDNPWIIGFFIDNESHWGNLRLLTAQRDMAVRQAWKDMIRKRFNDDLANVSQAFDTTFEDWDQVAAMAQEQIPESGAGRDAYEAFERQFTDRFFDIISRTYRKHDPNHLYLGCRFTRGVYRQAPELVRIHAPYTDVVSINCYDLFPRPEEFGQWYKLTEKPLIMGEHHFPLASQRQLPPLYPAFTASERRKLYVDFVRAWAEQPYTIGDHWFQHADQAATGRGQDGENQTVGFVDITDQPHTELVAALKEVAASVYDWKLSAAER